MICSRSILLHQVLSWPRLVLILRLLSLSCPQVFCVVLWSLDDYWYYSLFTLLMLVVFESTVVTSRMRNLDEMRELATPSCAALGERACCYSSLALPKCFALTRRHFLLRSQHCAKADGHPCRPRTFFRETSLRLRVQRGEVPTLTMGH